MVTNRDRKSFGSRPKKFQKLLRRLAPLTLLIRFQAFRDPLRGELPHVQIFMNDGPNPLTWDTQLLSYWFSRHSAVFQDQLVILSIISGMVTDLVRPGRGTSQVEKSPRFNWATQFLTVAYDGACSPNVSIRMAWISFGALPCRGEKNLMTVHVSMLLKSRASPDVLPFSLCNEKRLAIRHINIPLVPKTQSIPSYDIGKLVGLRIPRSYKWMWARYHWIRCRVCCFNFKSYRVGDNVCLYIVSHINSLFGQSTEETLGRNLGTTIGIIIFTDSLY